MRKRAVKALLYRLRDRAGARPALFYPLHGLRHPGDRRTVRRDTEIVIEGFPRSGNSFAVTAFELAQARPVRMADHLHVPAQLLRAAQYQRPACLLIREPGPAVRSLCVRFPHLTVADALESYRRFYARCLPVSDAFLTVPFEALISDFGAVIERLNRKFGTTFTPFAHTEENLSRVHKTLDERNAALGGNVLSSYLPNPVKEKAKAFIDLAPFVDALKPCEELYVRYLERAG
ncbi:MAG: hypothetical protein J4G10_04375 [Alphaproteobacteria bacterium]|nr:hypothetical protein [Alphaproteobacteria bacterium]